MIEHLELIARACASAIEYFETAGASCFHSIRRVHCLQDQQDTESATATSPARGEELHELYRVPDPCWCFRDFDADCCGWDGHRSAGSEAAAAARRRFRSGHERSQERMDGGSRRRRVR